MHFEFYIEDLSTEVLLSILIPRILKGRHTFEYRRYSGIGSFPKNTYQKSSARDIKSKALLNDLERVLRVLGKNQVRETTYFQRIGVIVCDLDKRCLVEFRKELFALRDSCDPVPTVYFCIAIEEIEAWLLGDKVAIESAYSRAVVRKLKKYKQDSICGTWELLAVALLSKDIDEIEEYNISKLKSEWAVKIGSEMDVDANVSPSFQYFRNKLRRLVMKTQILNLIS